MYAASSEPVLGRRVSLGRSLCEARGSGSASTKWWSEGRLRRLVGSKVGDTTPGDTAGGLLGDTVILKVYLVLGWVTTTRGEAGVPPPPLQARALGGGRWM